MDRPPPRQWLASLLLLSLRRVGARGSLVVIVLLVTPGLLVAASHRESAERDRGPDGYNWTRPEHHRPDPATLAIGVTHTMYSIGARGHAAADASAKAVLTATATYQNQHIFGWGALNPEPSPGVFDWTSLDQRMALIRSTGGVPIITLCCAPDWMKGGRPGQTDWTQISKAPTPKHYADFAALAVAVARRYPYVRDFQVWNELKGFWNTALNRWDYEAYTTFYNTVYDALKALSPQIHVGGPYVVIDTWAGATAAGHGSELTGECGTVDQRSLDVLDYWLKHKHGADFVSVDASSITRNRGLVTSTTVNAALFDAITRWLRQRTSIPIWWSEFHVGRADATGQPELVARATAALLHMVDAGAAVALIWQPESDAGLDGAHPPALWTSTANATGGRPLPFAEAVARTQQLLADRAAVDPVSWPQPDVGLLRGRHGLLFVHTAPGRVEVEAAGTSLRLAPYQVRYVPLPPNSGVHPPMPHVSPPDLPTEGTASRCLRLAPAQGNLSPQEET